MQKPSGLKIGYYYNYSSDIQVQFQNAFNSRYHFIVSPIINPRSLKFEPYCDLLISSSDWNKHVIAKIISNNYATGKVIDTERIEMQMNYTSHLGVPVILFDCPLHFDDITCLARIINAKISSSINLNMSQIWLQISLISLTELSTSFRGDIETNCIDNINGKGFTTAFCDSWQQWDFFRSLVTLDKRVGIALVMTAELPDEEYLLRWAGEPIKALIIPTTIFVTNRKGFPVLTKPHQNFLKLLIDKTARELQFIIKGPTKHQNIEHYAQYIDHLKNSFAFSPADAVSHFAQGYEDYLQIPLQPLMDNLESCTYEIFEKDPIKYSEYQRAITEALKKFIAIKDEVILMVVGAGRGPLVRASILAAESLKRKIHIRAIEKNTNAIVTLNHLFENEWGGKKGKEFATVEVIASDMRDYQSDKKADIVVSELLGSFSDNELSPECLDGVWSYVKDDAISIPESYSSYLVPIQSQKIFVETANLRERDRPHYSPFEWSYVVHLKNCYTIDQPKKLFTFTHKNLSLPSHLRDNSRYASLQFRSKLDCVCHGFSGYFETTLFDDIKLSTLPTNHTQGMFSWFPIYFPLSSPIKIKADEIIKVHFWRLLNKRQVWYEWCLTDPQVTPIHNPNGRSHNIGLL